MPNNLVEILIVLAIIVASFSMCYPSMKQFQESSKNRSLAIDKMNAIRKARELAIVSGENVEIDNLICSSSICSGGTYNFGGYTLSVGKYYTFKLKKENKKEKIE